MQVVQNRDWICAFCHHSARSVFPVTPESGLNYTASMLCVHATIKIVRMHESVTDFSPRNVTCAFSNWTHATFASAICWSACETCALHMALFHLCRLCSPRFSLKCRAHCFLDASTRKGGDGGDYPGIFGPLSSISVSQYLPTMGTRARE